MKVGISGIITPAGWTFEEFASNSVAAGYEAAELAIRDEGWLTLATAPEAIAEAVNTAQAVGLELSATALLCSGVDIMSNDAAVREGAAEKVLRGLRLTAGLGADTMLITPGRLGPQCHYDDAYYNALGTLRGLAAEVEQIGVNLALEYVWNWFLTSPLEYRRFLDEVDCPRIGFYFDSGNMVIQSYPEQWVKILGRHVKKVHLKDFRRSDSSWQPLGGGDVDFPAVLTELAAIGYEDALLSEVDESLAPLAQTARTIREMINQR